MKPAFAFAAVLVMTSAPSIAQSLPGNAPIIVDGNVLSDPATVPIEDQLDDGRLPGVFMDAPRSPNEEVRGPGGLQNNVGAIGTLAPSTSSANPVPLQGRGTDNSGLPLATGSGVR